MSTVPRRAGLLVAVLAAVSAALAVILLGGGGGAPPAEAHGRHADGVERRVQALIRDMSLREKVGQMGQINLFVLMGDPNNDWDRAPLNPAKLKEVLDDNQIGSILSGGGAWPSGGNDGRAWAEEINRVQQYAIEHQDHRIPMIYGVDAVHGHNNLSDATDFPHQVSLGATFDPALVYRLGRRTAEAVRATGPRWDFAPVLDTQRDNRWGRSYEPFGEDPLLNAVLGSTFIRGIERDGEVAATAKHFAGYSAPDSGLDRTDATISDAELQQLHLPPFQAGIDAGVDTVMVNSGSVNHEPVHASHRLLTDVLRHELGFRGVVITDWQDVENLVTKYHVADNMVEAVTLAINAGIDMSMIPLNAPEFVSSVEQAVAQGDISEARIDESVARILRLKFKLGLFEDPYADADAANAVVEDPGDRPLARDAARKSMVLLENDGTLPFRRSVDKVLVTGPASDDAPNQLGGWTVGWQGAFPPLPPDVTVPETTTIREGIEQAAPGGAEVTWKQGAPVTDTVPASGTQDPNNAPDAPAVVAARTEAVAAAQDADAVVVAVGESPYAEGMGDDPHPALTGAQDALVDALVATGKPVVVVVVAGRPLEMDAQLDGANASLMAFWPGSEGGAAVADVLFGAYNPSGRLTVSWPHDGAAYPIAYNEPGSSGRRYDFGYGLSYSTYMTTRLEAPSWIKARHGTVSIKATVRNTGSRAGSRTVLAFAERISGSAWAPRQLVGFARTWLPARASDKVKIPLATSQLPPGDYRLDVDGATQVIHVR